jgi:outer membrane protein assembly factor BamB
MRGETIYYGTHEGVIAFEPDGWRRWEWSPDTLGTDSPRTDTRIEGMALVCDHVAVLTVTEPELGYGMERTIRGIDIETGESQWTADVWTGAGLNSHRGRLVVGGETHARLDLANGDAVWTRENPTFGFTPTGDLTLGYGLAFDYTETADRKAITASTIPDGTIEWEHAVDTVAAPVGVANGRLIIRMETDESSRLAGIDAATGDRRWELESEFHDPVVGSERMYVIHSPDQDGAQATVRAVTVR